MHRFTRISARERQSQRVRKHIVKRAVNHAIIVEEQRAFDAKRVGYRSVPKFWTHRTIFYYFGDTSVREKAWRSRKRVAQAT